MIEVDAMSDVTTLDELNNELFEDLSAELSVADPQYDTKFEPVLKAKIKQAVRKVVNARNYPDGGVYTEEYVAQEVYNKFYFACRDLSLFLYNTVGAEFQQSHDENEIKRVWKDEATILNGVVPISRVV